MYPLLKQSFGVALLLGVLSGLTAPTVAAQEADSTEAPRQILVTILGMSCPFCAYGAEQKLKRLEGVTDLEVHLQSGVATLTLREDADIPNDRIHQAVRDAGFEVARIERTFPSDFPPYERAGGGDR